MILRRNRGLAASPPVPYRLKVAETVLLDLPAAAEGRDDLRVRAAGEIVGALHLFVNIPANGH